MLGDTDTIRVYDIDEHAWTATITGAASNLGKLTNAVFGYTTNEVLVFSDYGAKLTIWSLLSSRGVEIRDPKYAVACHDFRPTSGHLALLTRGNAQDILMILGPGSCEVLRSIELGTVDAQSVQWSRNGYWIAVRDVASAGHRVLIFTADGHLFRTFSGLETLSEVRLGVNCTEWTSADTLLVGDNNDTATLLSRNTVSLPPLFQNHHHADNGQFSPISVFYHLIPIISLKTQLWEEQINAHGERTYKIASQPAHPPSASSSAKTAEGKRGVSMMVPNQNGELLVTKCDAAPTTVWIWSLQNGNLVAVLIHHSPIRQVMWHPSHLDILLIQCTIPEPAVHLWKRAWDEPLVLKLPLQKASGKIEASWLQSRNDDTLNIILTSMTQSVTAQISGAGQLLPYIEEVGSELKCNGSGPEDMFDEGNSLDLSPVKLEATAGFGSLNGLTSGSGSADEAIDDTFQYRKQIKAS